MKKQVSIPLMTLCVLLLAGCGHVKSAKKLIRQARSEHGSCKVISQTETEDKTEVVLQDDLQGFTYTVRSYMTDINIDGSSFGSLPETRDGFMKALTDYALKESEDEVEALMQECDATFQRESLSIDAKDKENGIAACTILASILQKYNLENRMDGLTINVRNKEDHLGSCRLPELSFRTPEKEKEDDYMRRAQNLMSSVSPKNRSLTFVKKESVPFSKLGIPLSRVSSYSWNKVTTISDTVTLYYYQTNQQLFYIADFIDNDTGADYTNFDLSLEKAAKGEKGIFHFHFHMK